MRAERALGKVSRDERNWPQAFSREIGEMDSRPGLAAAEAKGRAEGIVEGEAKAYNWAKKELYQEKLDIARKLKTRGRP